MPKNVTLQDQQKRFPIAFSIGVLLCTILVAIWREAQSYSMSDLYPLYYGGLAWRQSGNAYQLKPVVPESTYEDPILAIGNGYPLPAVLLLLPFTFLPAKIASIVWISLLTAGVLIALRINRLPYYICLYLPIADGIRLEQYAILVVALQFIALWAYRERRYWILAVCCTLILTKPSQGLIFVLALLLLTRKWQRFFIVSTVVWGGSMLLDPKWVGEWLAALPTYLAASQTVAPWAIIILAIPLLLIKDYISAALIAQLALFPHQTTYTSAAVPLGVIHDKRSKWLIPLSYLWPIAAYYLSKIWGTALCFALPAVLLSILRWLEQAYNPGQK